MTTAAAAAAVLTLAFCTPAAMASGTQDISESTQTGMSSPGSSLVAGVRPQYTASDYVDVSDGKYKSLHLTLLGPVDSSDEAKAQYQTDLDTEIMKQLFNLYPVSSYPDSLLTYMTSGLTETYQEMAGLYGMDFGSFLQTYLKMDEDTFASEVSTMAKTAMTQELILKAVAEKENLSVSDGEYTAGLEAYAKKYGYSSTDALLQDFDEPTVRISLLMDKTMDFLETSTEVTDPSETETEESEAAVNTVQ